MVLASVNNLLDEPLKGFIVNPTGLPRKGVKRLVTLGKMVNHDSQWNCTTSIECKTDISAVLTVTSGLGPIQNKWSLMEIINVIIVNMLFMLFFIHFTWSWVYYGSWQLDVTHMLKLWQLKATSSWTSVTPRKPQIHRNATKLHKQQLHTTNK